MIAAALFAMALETVDHRKYVAAIRPKRRVLIVSAPSRRDAALLEQERLLARWQQGASERDVTVLEVIGDGQDRGFEDNPATVRQRYRLSLGRFGLVLIGKDGNVALRSARPLTGARLQAAIDAMPMRRAGLR